MASLSSVDGLRTAALVSPVVAFAVTAAAVPLSIKVARRFGVLDAPTARSSHTVPTPRLGGMAVVAGAVVGLGAALALAPDALRSAADATDAGVVLVVAALLLAAIGLADDLVRGIPVTVRLVGQALVGLGVVAPWVLGLHPRPATVGSAALAASAAVGLIAFVNVFNFMDGVDGISAAVATVMGLHLALLGVADEHAALVVAGLAVAGAAAGFLPRNLRPATVFLGDGGSYFLGGWLAVGGVVAVGLGTPPVAVLAVTLPYLADTSTTLVDRIRRGEDWRASHQEHAYQRLVLAGWSHRRVAALLAGLTAACGLAGVASVEAPPAGQGLALVAAAALSGGYVVLSRRSLTAGARHLDDVAPGVTASD